MSLFLAMLGTVLFWSGVVGIVYSMYRVFVPGDVRAGFDAPVWAVVLCCIMIAVVGYALLYISGVG